MENFDIQGHRGCRGLMPENTIPAFLKACELGVTTLEMDVVLTSDGSVVVSHEPFFNHEIATSSFEVPITAENERQFNIYQMIYPTLQRFDVGMKVHPRFPEQKKIAVIKPLLKDVVKAVKDAGYDPHYNIEIKYVKEEDGIFHPSAYPFAQKVIEQVKELGIMPKTTIQCFNHECLDMVHTIDATIKTVLLVEDQKPFLEHLSMINHKPFAYSPDFTLVDSALVASCHAKGIKIIPWTVNEIEDMQRIIALNVDGIITDYPDRLINIVR